MSVNRFVQQGQGHTAQADKVAVLASVGFTQIGELELKQEAFNAVNVVCIVWREE